MKTILNFGAGINSTALIIELVKRNMKPDHVIFADTGNELPETYEHVERMKNWFEKNGISFLIVKSKYGIPLYDYYFAKKTIPWRKFRDCTDKFKKAPIAVFLKQFKNEGVMQYIGISIDEVHRVRKSEIKWIELSYPLVEWRIDRKKCIEIIEREGLKVPVKSGCFLCPFQPLESWKNLFNIHPELFAKAEQMEKQNRTYPDNTLIWKGTLEMFRRNITEQTDLRSCFEMGVEKGMECPYGICMT